MGLRRGTRAKHLTVGDELVSRLCCAVEWAAVPARQVLFERIGVSLNISKCVELN